MYIEASQNFATAQALATTSDTVSTNVLDVGSAKKAFGGAGHPVKVSVGYVNASGTSPTFRARLVGADNAGLSSGVEILADTGANPVTAGVPVVYELVPSMQKATKRYYGVVFTQGGTSPVGAATANLVLDAQSNG
jgi:hypothetical protein